jgi:hypothetical protein
MFKNIFPKLKRLVYQQPAPKAAPAAAAGAKPATLKEERDALKNAVQGVLDKLSVSNIPKDEQEQLAEKLKGSLKDLEGYGDDVSRTQLDIVRARTEAVAQIYPQYAALAKVEKSTENPIDSVVKAIKIAQNLEQGDKAAAMTEIVAAAKKAVEPGLTEVSYDTSDGGGILVKQSDKNPDNYMVVMVRPMQKPASEGGVIRHEVVYTGDKKDFDTFAANTMAKEYVDDKEKRG